MTTEMTTENLHMSVLFTSEPAPPFRLRSRSLRPAHRRASETAI
jgi:hypothetical protein